MLKTCLVGLGIEIAGNTLRHSPAWISEYGEPLFPSKRTTGVFLAGVGQSIQYYSLMAPVTSYISASFSSASTASAEVRLASYIGLTALGLGCAAVLLHPVITNIFLANADNCCEAIAATRKQSLRFPHFPHRPYREHEAHPLYKSKSIFEAIEMLSTGTVKALCIGSLLFNQPLAVTVGAGTVMSISLLTK